MNFIKETDFPKIKSMGVYHFHPECFRSEQRLKWNYGGATVYLHPTDSNSGKKIKKPICVMKDGRLMNSKIARDWWEKKLKKGGE